MHIIQTHKFKRTIKKLKPNQKKLLDKAIKIIINTPDIGDEKIGDLIGVRVYKFTMINQLTLLAYIYEIDTITLTLLDLGSHKNFYRDLKKII